jgi:hypothetical protein
MGTKKTCVIWLCLVNEKSQVHFGCEKIFFCLAMCAKRSRGLFDPTAVSSFKEQGSEGLATSSVSAVDPSNLR